MKESAADVLHSLGTVGQLLAVATGILDHFHIERVAIDRGAIASRGSKVGHQPTLLGVANCHHVIGLGGLGGSSRGGGGGAQTDGDDGTAHVGNGRGTVPRREHELAVLATATCGAVGVVGDGGGARARGIVNRGIISLGRKADGGDVAVAGR